jgi:PKD domain
MQSCNGTGHRRARWWSCAGIFLGLIAATMVGFPGTAGAAESSAFKAVVKLSPASTTIDRLVTAKVNTSTLPAGAKVKKITLSWGDGSKAVKLAKLTAKATHRFLRPGDYKVALTIIDTKGKTARDSAVAVVKAPAGSYTGSYPTDVYEPITFYVSGNEADLQDIAIPSVSLTCAPGGAAVGEPFLIASVPLKANGSFSKTTTQQGVYQGYPATFTYTFSGNISGVNADGAVTVAGSFRETLAYTAAAAYDCTSNDQSWSATRDAQPAQTTSRPPAGSYTGSYPTDVYEPITFYVSGNQADLQDIAIPSVSLTCAPGDAAVGEPFTIASATLNADGSFSATSTEDGVYDGYPATFTFTFQGNFHGVAPSGAARAAGWFRETLAYTGSAAYDCTSNDQSWTAELTSG